MKQEGQRIFGLDILRAFAILTVVVVHMWGMFPNTVPDIWRSGLFFNGVNIFFVLSGYLIGSILLKIVIEKGPSFKNLVRFWRDRWLRTLPAYYCVLLITMTIVVIYTNKTIYDFRLIFFFIEHPNGSGFRILTGYWSLAVEEWFYLITPLLIFIGASIWPLKKVVPVTIAIIFIFSNAVRIASFDFAANHFNYSLFPYSIPARIDNIMFGVLGAYLNFYRFNIWTNYRNRLFVLGLTGYCCNHFYKVFAGDNLYNFLFQLPVELLFILMVFPKISTIREGKGAIARIITFIATISYSIYLVHSTLFLYAIKPRFTNHSWLLLPAYLIWAFGAGYLLYITVEKWGMKFRDTLRQKAAFSDQKNSMTDRIEKTILIKADPSTVWQTLTEPARMKQWMGDAEMQIDIQTNWQVNSAIIIAGFHHLKFENKGTVLQFEPSKLLRYNFLSSLSRLPNVPENYTIIEFALSPAENQTSLTLVISNFPTETIYHHLNFYWRTTIVLIKNIIEENAPSAAHN